MKYKETILINKMIEVRTEKHRAKRKINNKKKSRINIKKKNMDIFGKYNP